MASFNKVILMGNLTRDPEVRFTTGGTAICAFGMAMNRRYTTAQGEEKDEVCFVDVEVLGRQAEPCGNYLRKGAPTFVEGSLRLDQWNDKATGQKRNRLLVRAERVQFLNAPQRGAGGFGGDEEGAPAHSPSAPAPAYGGQEPPQSGGYAPRSQPPQPAYGNAAPQGGYAPRAPRPQAPAPQPQAMRDTAPPPMPEVESEPPPPVDDIPF